MHHDIWNAITNTNPGLAGTLLLAGFIGVMASGLVACRLSPTVDRLRADPCRAKRPASLVHPIASRFHHGPAKPRDLPFLLKGEFYQPSRCQNVCVAIDLRCRGDRLVGNKLQHEMLVIRKRDAHWAPDQWEDRPRPASLSSRAMRRCARSRADAA